MTTRYSNSNHVSLAYQSTTKCKNCWKKRSFSHVAGSLAYLQCLTKATPSLLAREHALTCRPLCKRMQAVARFASRCTCAAAGEVQRRQIGPPPTPVSPNHAGRVTTRAESVGVHANLCQPCTSFYVYTVYTYTYRSKRIHARAACYWCARFPPVRMQHSYRFVARNRSSRWAAVQSTHACIASFLVRVIFVSYSYRSLRCIRLIVCESRREFLQKFLQNLWRIRRESRRESA